jgi:hypothetical protein
VLVALHPYEALACFGHRTLQLRAWVVDAEGTDACKVELDVRRCIEGPTWLAGVGGRSAFLDALSVTATSGPGPMALGIDPTGSVTGSDLPVGRMTAIEGAFDHPVATSCAFAGQPSPVPTLTADAAVLRCRTQFVVSRAAPDGNFLLPQTAAVTTTDGLRVRSRPIIDDTSEKLSPLLASATRLFVLQGPVAGSGYDWYQVVAPGISRAGGGPMVGWIAVASKTGQAWAKALPLDCPAPDTLVSLADMARLASGAFPDGGLSCFAGRTITTRGNLHLGCAPSRPTPAANWLSQASAVSFVLTDGVPTFTGRVRPEDVQAFCNMPQDANWNVEGHFDDPGSASCAAPAAADPAALAARYQCRSLFVVTLMLRNG